MIGRFELNKVYCEDSYKAIKELPDKCIDCIYTDIPYLYNQGGSGTSCVASMNIGRKCLGFEIEKKWADIANDRLNNIDANGQYSFILK